MAKQSTLSIEIGSIQITNEDGDMLSIASDSENDQIIKIVIGDAEWWCFKSEAEEVCDQIKRLSGE